MEDQTIGTHRLVFFHSWFTFPLLNEWNSNTFLLGLVISLKDPKWGTAIDSALGKTLNIFAVDNVNDMQLLNQIGKRVGTYVLSFFLFHFNSLVLFKLQSELDIVVQRFTNEMYRLTERDLPPSNLVTILSQINAVHPMVYNILIDQVQNTNAHSHSLSLNNHTYSLTAIECDRDQDFGWEFSGGPRYYLHAEATERTTSLPSRRKSHIYEVRIGFPALLTFFFLCFSM